ncbi:MAG: glycosyltransferase family 39 protein [Steroidobacteraceae bacterium]
MAASTRLRKHTMSEPGSRRSSSVGWLLCGILLTALLIRLPGFLYPASLHYDEGSELSNVLCMFPPGGTLAHPLLNRYLLTVPTGLQCVRSRLHETRPEQNASAWFDIDPEPFLHSGRVVSMLCGLAAILAAFALGRAVGNTKVGLVAAAVIAFAPMPMLTSINLRPWALALLLSTVVLLVASQVADDGSRPRKWLALLGAASGAATAAVYTLGLTVIPVMGALVGRWSHQAKLGAVPHRAKDLATTAMGWIAAHAVCNYHALTQLPQVVRAVTGPDASRWSGSGEEFGYMTNVAWHAGALFDKFGLGIVIASLGVAGLLLAVRRGGWAWLSFLVFLVGYLLLQPLVVVLMSTRYAAAAVPVVALGAAWLIVQLGERIAATSPWLARLHPTAILTAIAIAPNVVTCVEYARALSLTPTRQLALQWIEGHIPAQTTIVQSIKYVSPVLMDCASVAKSPFPPSPQRPCYHVLYLDQRTYRAPPQRTIDYLEGANAEYLVYTSATPPGTEKRLRRVNERLLAIEHRYQLVATFRYQGLDGFTDDTATVNPVVRVFRLK